MQSRRRNRIQISRDLIFLFLLFIFVLLYYKSHFRQTCHLYSGEMSKRHLVEDSDRSNNIFTAISSEISTWMLKEMFQSINQSIFIRPEIRVTANRCVFFDSFTYIYPALLPQHWALYAKVDSAPTSDRDTQRWIKSDSIIQLRTYRYR